MAHTSKEKGSTGSGTLIGAGQSPQATGSGEQIQVDEAVSGSRLTEPDAMHNLKGGKTAWHIATGVVAHTKRLTPDEMAAMVARLCAAKKDEDPLPPKPHAVRLVYDEAGKEAYAPVKHTTRQENEEYMSALYQRCQESKEKTAAELKEKYLQPLGRPKRAAA